MPRAPVPNSLPVQGNSLRSIPTAVIKESRASVASVGSVSSEAAGDHPFALPVSVNSASDFLIPNRSTAAAFAHVRYDALPADVVQIAAVRASMDDSHYSEACERLSALFLEYTTSLGLHSVRDADDDFKRASQRVRSAERPRSSAGSGGAAGAARAGAAAEGEEEEEDSQYPKSYLASLRLVRSGGSPMSVAKSALEVGRADGGRSTTGGELSLAPPTAPRPSSTPCS